MSDLMLDVDQAGELKAAFRRGDWTNAEIKGLCEGDILKRVRDVVRGFAEIVTKQHVIDCDQDPFCPSGWSVESHQKAGQFTWDPTRVEPYLSPHQRGGKTITGTKLQKELSGMSVLNANVLDYLFDHPELIPEDWKGKYVYFWGTIYRHSDGNLNVRYLYWLGGQWHWGYDWLDPDWNGNSPAVLVRK